MTVLARHSQSDPELTLIWNPGVNKTAKSSSLERQDPWVSVQSTVHFKAQFSKKKKKKKKPKNGVSHFCSLHPHFDVHEIRIKNLDQDKRAAPKIVLYCFCFLFCFFFFYYLEGGGVGEEWGGEEDLGTEEDSKLFSFSSALLLWGGLQHTEGISSWGVTFLRAL